jgi:hypothetical protein
VAPDANPYMVMLAVFKTGLEGEIAKEAARFGLHHHLPMLGASLPSARIGNKLPRSQMAGSSRDRHGSCWWNQIDAVRTIGYLHGGLTPENTMRAHHIQIHSERH